MWSNLWGHRSDRCTHLNRLPFHPQDPMRHGLPQLLCRAYSDESQGINTEALFAPALHADMPASVLSNGMRYCDYCDEFKVQLTKALYGKSLQCLHKGEYVRHCPFKFWSSSLLIDYMHALMKKNWKKEQNVRIMIINTSTARTAEGKPVNFVWVPDLMGQYRVGPLGSRHPVYPHLPWQPRNFSDVWATTDTIVPGHGSYFISLDALQSSGFFDLFPALRTISKRRNPGLEKPATDLQMLWFEPGAENNLTHPELNLAAKIAAKWRLLNRTLPTEVPMPILAWLLSLCNVDLDGPYLVEWLNQYSEKLENTEEDDQPPHMSGVVEYDKFQAVYNTLRGRKIAVNRIAGEKSVISKDLICKRLTAYGIYMGSLREEYRETECMNEKQKREREDEIREEVRRLGKRKRAEQKNDGDDDGKHHDKNPEDEVEGESKLEQTGEAVDRTDEANLEPWDRFREWLRTTV